MRTPPARIHRVAMASARWLLSALLLVSASVWAARPEVRASLLVDGTIGVTPQGSVLAYTLKQPEALPKPVVALLARAIPHWRFEPVLRNGEPVVAKASMHIRIVARRTGNDQFELRIAGTQFGDDRANDSVRLGHRTPPRYPIAAVRARVTGSVYLVLRVDRDGHVDKAAAEQVNLGQTGSPGQMRAWRRMFAEASVDAAKSWTFGVPAPQDRPPGRDHWIVRVPLTYTLQESPGRPEKPAYGAWQTYIPGPHENVPWLTPQERPSEGVDALPEGSAYLAEQPLHRIPVPSI